MLRSIERIRSLGHGVTDEERDRDVVIEIARERDGSVFVLPAVSA